MSIEILSQLEEKIQQTIDTIGLLQMEIDELKEENQRLKQEQTTWHGRLQNLLSQINEIK